MKKSPRHRCANQPQAALALPASFLRSLRLRQQARAHAAPTLGGSWFEPLEGRMLLSSTLGANDKTVVNDPVLMSSIAPVVTAAEVTASDPAVVISSNVLVNNPSLDGTSASDTQSETNLMVFGSTVLVAYNDSHSNVVASNKFTGYSRSIDGGVTFTDMGELPTAANGDVGDPSWAYDNVSGRTYLLTLMYSGSGNELFRSNDGGATLLAPVNPMSGFGGGDFLDKPWITVDNFAGTGQGNVYVVARNFTGGGTGSQPNGIYLTRSTDGGATFSAGTATPIIQSNSNQGAYVTVGADHAVYVFWLDQSSGLKIKMRRSTDLGVTFGSTITVASLLGTASNGDLGLGFRTNCFPQAVVNPVNGNIYVAYPDNPAGADRADVYFTRSSNNGTSWTTPVRVNDDSTTNDQWQPALAVKPNGTQVFLGFYDRRLDSGNSLINTFATIGNVDPVSGAVTFQANFRVSDAAFPAVYGVDPKVNSTYMGDYDTAAADNSGFFYAWGDNRDASLGHAGNNANVRFARITNYLNVASSTPANGSVVAVPPTDFVIDFANNYDASTVNAADLTVNAIPADSFALTDANTVTFHFNASPVTAQGAQSLAMAAGSITGADGSPLAAFAASFRYDVLPIQVASTIPADSSTVPLPLTSVTLKFNEPYDAGSIGTDDLTLVGQGAVTGYSLISSDTVQYTLSGVTSEGTLTLRLAAGAVTDVYGNPGPAYLGSLVLDNATSAYPTPLVSVAPLGSLVYDPLVAGSIGFAGDTDSYTLNLDAGQTVTIVAHPTVSVAVTLQPTLQWRDPSNALLGSATAAAVGQDALLQTIPVSVSGTYTLTVGAVGSSTGAYSLQVILNAAAELESHNGPDNSTLAAAQDINGSFLALTGSASRGAAIGTLETPTGYLPNEIEPNNTLATANPAMSSFVPYTGNLYQMGLKGTISNGNTDEDTFTIGQLQAGDVLTITQNGVLSSRGTLGDPVVYLIRSNGGSPVIVISDDDSGTGLDSLVYRFAITDTDTYYVRASRFTGTGTYDLALYLEDEGTPPLTGGTITTESEPNDKISTSNDVSNSWRKVQYSSTTSGAITSGDVDTFEYQFTAGDLVSLNIHSTSNLKARVALLSSDGTTVAFEDGTSVGPGLDSFVDGYIIPSSGSYYMQVQAASNTGSYQANVYLSTTATPPLASPATDFYAFNLAAGDTVSLAVKGPAGASLDLLDGGGLTLASGVSGALNVDQAISAFPVANGGTYYARVRGANVGAYNLLVNRNAIFDLESNNALASAQDISATHVALGAVSATSPADVDFYSLALNTGDTVQLRTLTPADGAGEFVNALDAAIDLYSPAGVLLASDDNSAPDGRNALLSYTIGSSGLYNVAVRATAGQGEYVLTASTQQGVSATPGVPDLLDVSDSGISNSDDLTNRNNTSGKELQFSVGSTVPGALVRIYADGVLIGSATATGATTVVTTNGAVALANGARSITARQVEPGSLESADSSALTVTINATAPAAPAPLDLQAASDSGSSNTDNYTNILTPTFDLPAGLSYFRVYRNGVQISGNYQTGSTFAAPAEIADGAPGFTLTAVDAAGNESTPSTPLTVTFDTAAPTADVVDVTPDPRTTPVSSVTIAFNEIVGGVDMADLALTRNGGANLLTVSQSVITGNGGLTWTLSDLTSLTNTTGNYLLTLTAASSGIADRAGNLLQTSASDAFAVNFLPTIGTLSASPAMVNVGSSMTLTATNVTSPNGAIVQVEFYRDTNNNGQLDIGVDTRVAVDTSSAGGWTKSFTAALPGTPAGQVARFFARAQDATLVWGLAATATNIVNALPTIGTFAVSPSAIIPGASVTLTAGNVADSDGSVQHVFFYLNTNTNTSWDTSDQLLGEGVLNLSGQWVLSNVSTAGLPTGTVRYFARAQDNRNAFSAAKTATAKIDQPPVVGALAVSPAVVTKGDNITLTATGVTDADSAVSAVEFWRDVDHDGTITTTDKKIGNGTLSGSSWVLTASTSGFAVGTTDYLARAKDVEGAYSTALAHASNRVNNPPTISSLTVSPSTVTLGQNITLTAVASDTDGTIASVAFYLDNGDGIFDAASDIPLGNGVLTNGKWVLSGVSTASFPLGSVKYFARAQDNDGGYSAAKSAAGTVNAPASPTQTFASLLNVNQIKSYSLLSLTDPQDPFNPLP